MEINHWLPLYPEITMLFSIGFILMTTLYLPPSLQWLNYRFSQIALIVVAFFSFNLMSLKHDYLLNGMFVVDPMAYFLKCCISLLGCMVFFYARKTLMIKDTFKSQYFILCLFSILGMMVVISASHFLSLYLGLELMVLPLYALISLDREARSTEAALKYFLLGVLSSAFLLYGISLLYGMTGHLNLESLMQALSLDLINQPALVGSLVFILVAVLFKLGVVPFHVWLPDIYEGSATPVTLFLGTLPKIAAFAFAIRLFNGLLPQLEHLKSILILAGLLCLLLGHLGAITQSNLKRMLAYSAIAQMGFVILAFMLGVTQGFAIALYYLLIYVIAVLAFLGVLSFLGDDSVEADRLKSLEGLGHTNPWLGCVMIIILLSLIGIPPFAGFYAKLWVIKALMSAGLLSVAVLALVLTVVGAFYYLRIISLMFFNTRTLAVPRVFSAMQIGIFSLNGLALLLLGIFPAPLLSLCNSLLFYSFR